MKQREIKFRAWNGKEMIYEAGFCFNHINQLFKKDFTDVFIIDGIESGEILYNGDYGDCIIMQSTGLKDKNGKEIYEGDIVEHYHLGEVIKSIIHWNEEKAMFCLRYDGDKLNGHHLNNSQYTVIGNIYEDYKLCQ